MRSPWFCPSRIDGQNTETNVFFPKHLYVKSFFWTGSVFLVCHFYGVKTQYDLVLYVSGQRSIV